MGITLTASRGTGRMYAAAHEQQHTAGTKTPNRRTAASEREGATLQAQGKCRNRIARITTAQKEITRCREHEHRQGDQVSAAGRIITSTFSAAGSHRSGSLSSSHRNAEKLGAQKEPKGVRLDDQAQRWCAASAPSTDTAEHTPEGTDATTKPERRAGEAHRAAGRRHEAEQQLPTTASQATTGC